MNLFSMILFLTLSVSSNDPSRGPHIVTQHAEKDGSRTLYVHNPLDRAVWTWYECSNVISVEPIGLPGRQFSEIHLKSNDTDVAVDDNTCYILKWKVQGKGGSVED